MRSIDWSTILVEVTSPDDAHRVPLNSWLSEARRHAAKPTAPNKPPFQSFCPSPEHLTECALHTAHSHHTPRVVQPNSSYTTTPVVRCPTASREKTNRKHGIAPNIAGGRVIARFFFLSLLPWQAPGCCRSKLATGIGISPSKPIEQATRLKANGTNTVNTYAPNKDNI